MMKERHEQWVMPGEIVKMSSDRFLVLECKDGRCQITWWTDEDDPIDVESVPRRAPLLNFERLALEHSGTDGTITFPIHRQTP